MCQDNNKEEQTEEKNLGQDNPKQERSEEQEGEGASDTNSGTSTDQTRVTEEKLWYIE